MSSSIGIAGKGSQLRQPEVLKISWKEKYDKISVKVERLGRKAIMNYYFYKLVPPMSGGSGTGDADDGKLIAAHDAYLKDQMAKGNVVAFGSVADPNGSYSLAILRLDNEEDAGLVLAADPALSADEGFEYELFSMPDLTIAD